jgi:hypothetical protein
MFDNQTVLINKNALSGFLKRNFKSDSFLKISICNGSQFRDIGNIYTGTHFKIKMYSVWIGLLFCPCPKESNDKVTKMKEKKRGLIYFILS